MIGPRPKDLFERGCAAVVEIWCRFSICPFCTSRRGKTILTPDPLLAKPRIDFPLASENVLESFINDKKNTKGLTASGKGASEIL